MRLPTQLLRRRRDSHKGDFGHVFILAGSARYSGAACLCSLGCLRLGAGLVTLGLPAGINDALIRIKPAELITLPLPETNTGELGLKAYGKINKFINQVDILVIGPGLGRSSQTSALARRVIASSAKPTVIDADALNALSGNLGILERYTSRRRITVITPHPGEMSRLTAKNVRQIQADRKNTALNFAKKHKVILVLKGHKTVVAEPGGRSYVNNTGNPGMSKAGSGDILTGMIGALLGQGLDGFQAAKYAVYLHGLAGDLAAKEKTQLSLIASDIINQLPEAIKLSS